MGTKKNLFMVLVLLFVCAGMLFFGCDRGDDTDNTVPDPIDRPGYWQQLEVPIGHLIGMMRPPQIDHKKKKSLAKHIIRDYILLRIYFMTKKWGKMDEIQGIKGIVYTLENGETISWAPGDVTKTLSAFWEATYSDKFASFPDHDIELEIKPVSIRLEEEEGTTSNGIRFDCTSLETFKFSIIAIRDGRVISNRGGDGEWKRDHSEECPWIEP